MSLTKTISLLVIMQIISTITFAQEEITVKELESHLEFLASDSLKGRLPGTDEGFIAGVPGKTGSEDYRITIAKDKFVQLRKGKSKITMEDDDITFVVLKVK